MGAGRRRQHEDDYDPRWNDHGAAGKPQVGAAPPERMPHVRMRIEPSHDELAALTAGDADTEILICDADRTAEGTVLVSPSSGALASKPPERSSRRPERGSRERRASIANFPNTYPPGR